MRRLLMALCALILLACAGMPAQPLPDPPALRLEPASLGRTLVEQQLLTVRARGTALQLNVALEVDTEAVRMAVLQLGHVVARLEWDGTRLHEQRLPGWPDAASGMRILEDLQWLHWPLPTLRTALPNGWDLSEINDTRTLLWHDQPVIVIHRFGLNRARLDHRAGGYVLDIETIPAGGMQ